VTAKELDMLAVGMVVKPFGVRGEVIVQPMTDSPSRFRRLNAVWVGENSASAQQRAVEKAVPAPHGIRMKLKGIDDRTAAERTRGQLLFVDKANQVHPPAGRYFVHDVIGLVVRGEEGIDLGTITDVLHYPASDVYVVRGKRGDVQIPAVKEFVKAIDIENRIMTVRLIEGLVE
jgi:16S rRNA processing protein RimM